MRLFASSAVHGLANKDLTPACVLAEAYEYPILRENLSFKTDGKEEAVEEIGETSKLPFKSLGKFLTVYDVYLMPENAWLLVKAPARSQS